MVKRFTVAVAAVMMIIAISSVALVVSAQTGNRYPPLAANGFYQANGEEQALNAVYQNVIPSVVAITVISGQGAGAGSGFVIDLNGYIVTNNHVVEGSEFIRVQFFDGTQVDADLIGLDAYSDLAVIKVDPTQVPNLKPVTFADSDNVFVGQTVLALGNPYEQSFTLTTGIVSALDRSITADNNFSIPEVIQTDAAINPGNSGGPLVDLFGNVIGVNSAILTESGSGSGVGFAIPANEVRRVAPYLIAEGQYRHTWLGISGTTLQPEQRSAMNLGNDVRGVMVAEVVGGGPADRAGLQPASQGIRTPFGNLPVGGDIIVAVNNTPVQAMSDLISYLGANTLPGDNIILRIIRNGQSLEISVNLDERPR